MYEIRLTPAGKLRWEADQNVDISAALKKIASSFNVNWAEGLFLLSAKKVNVADFVTLQYWQGVGDCYLTQLCHIPEEEKAIAIPAPTSAKYAEWTLTAPPMQGGEYLSVEMLEGIWQALDSWTKTAIDASGSLGIFLNKVAPKWAQIGRVCFHLAENKADEKRPFAFMASYTTGFGISGKIKHQPLHQALSQYAGTKNTAALVRLLSPVQRASEGLPWVKALVDTGSIYQPMVWTADRAYQFLCDVTVLEECGVSVRLPNWWQKRVRPKVSVKIGTIKASTLGVDTMLDFDVAVALGNISLSHKELQELLEGPDGLIMLKGQWVEVDREKLQEAITHWETLHAQSHNGKISFIEGMRLLAGATEDLKDQEELDDLRPWAQISAGDALRETLAALRCPKRLDQVKNDGVVDATLRPYQREGVAWLRFLSELGLGACLADDMGLGKTLQVLALLQHSKHNRISDEIGPALLIVPASLMGNWRSEAERFTPSLRLLFAHPAEIDKKTLDSLGCAPLKTLAHVDMVITTYAMTTRQSWLGDVVWNMIILDEAQAIKNPGSRQSKAVKKLKASSRIALTGTPVENRVGDLWSIFDFLNPGLLGSSKVFSDFIKNLEGRSENQFAPLRKLIAPYILRRLKTDRSIIADLPDKTEALAYCNMTRSQIRLYKKSVQSLEEALKSSENNIARRGLVLQYLMRFKQICNHPSQAIGAGEYVPGESGKFLRLAEICEEIAARQEKVLIFTQFREIIEPLEAHLTTVFGRHGLILHGGTSVKKRPKIVEQFQSEDGPPFFILSLKAGGSGLNLTAASHVVHFDRWWNPAVENQATDRAFRIGQKKNVLVHKFVARGTIEEHINELITAKQTLATELLSDNSEIKLTELDDKALLSLVHLDITSTII